MIFFDLENILMEIVMEEDSNLNLLRYLVHSLLLIWEFRYE